MAELVKYIYGTEEQILALTSESASWIEKAFYYPSDKGYFYQLIDGIMKKYGGNEPVQEITELTVQLAGVKTLIEIQDTLEIPVNFDYNTFKLDVEGIVNCEGRINIM